MIAAILTAAVLLALVAFLCWRLSRLHLTAAAHCQCIADMLTHPDRAEQIADASRRDLIARGLWRSK